MRKWRCEVKLLLTRTLWRSRAVHSVNVAGRNITGLMDRRTPADQGRVHPRHYPPRSCWYLDSELMEREMYGHMRDKQTQ